MTNTNKLAGALTIAAIAFAFLTAMITQDNGAMSLSPPPTDGDPNPVPDIDNAKTLHTAAYTAWAALVLVVPAFIAFPFRKRSTRAANIWRPFWTGAYVAFLVHMLYSMGAFFGWDFDWMRNTSRVSAFWPGIIVLMWWPVDLVLAWSDATSRAIDIQRLLLTIILFVLFVGGSAVTGEMLIIRIIGAALFIAMLATLALRYLRPEQNLPKGTP